MGRDPIVVKKQIQAEASCHSRWGAVKTWSFLIGEIFINDIKAAKEFMISEHGGYDLEEVERIIKKRQTNISQYQRSFIAEPKLFKMER